MMQRLKSDDQDHISEQIEVAARLYAEDQRKSEALKARLAATQAAEEMGIQASYMEQAAVELSAHRVKQGTQRKRKAGILAASLAVVAAFGAWSTSHKTPLPPPPLVYDFAAPSQGQWHLDGLAEAHPEAQVSLTLPREQGHPVALVKINQFSPSSGADYAVDLDTNQVPRPLTGYRVVSFRVRGQGLRQIRLFLQNGEERWCSPFLTASGGWHEIRIPLSQFLHQRVPAQYNPRDEPYVAPTVIGKVSFKLGRDANPPDEHGEVAVDDLRFE